jgi:hypothetical protein
VSALLYAMAGRRAPPAPAMEHVGTLSLTLRWPWMRFWSSAARACTTGCESKRSPPGGLGSRAVFLSVFALPEINDQDLRRKPIEERTVVGVQLLPIAVRPTERRSVSKC